MALRFTLRQLEYFVAVGEVGSISQAAERLNISSPSISAAISTLEKEFGLPLFVRRHAHGLSLTRAGRQFMVQARTVLAEAEALTRLAGDISGSVQGPLNVGCLLTFAQMILPPLRRQFEDAYPDVQVSQLELDQSAIFRGLQSATIDVALSYDMAIPADLKFLPLRVLPPYAMVHETHPLAHLPEVSVAELTEHPMVLLDLPLSSDYFLSFFEKADTKPRIAERTRDMAVMRSLVANGFGYGIGNIRPHSDISADGRKLVFIPLTGGIAPMRLGLIMAEGAERMLTVRAFADLVREAMDGWNYPGFAPDAE